VVFCDVAERHLLTNRKASRTSTGRVCREMRIAIGGEIRRMRVDAGLTQRRLAALAAIDHGFLSLIERGMREPSLAVLVAIATALGGTVNVRLYAGTGPRLTDPIQARITEALVRLLHPRWTRLLEVPVYRPVRGVIDLVLHDRAENVVVATEIQSQMRRLEQQLRWSNEKADALPSADFWRFTDPAPRIERLLILRSTRVNRELASRFSQTLDSAYPTPASAAYEALTTPDRSWPGDALIWATVNGDTARILDRPPRGVVIGRWRITVFARRPAPSGRPIRWLRWPVRPRNRPGPAAAGRWRSARRHRAARTGRARRP
jgi:transcriptional regulator with XRE-family HTH domain